MARKLTTIVKAITKKLTGESRTNIEIGELLIEARDAHFTNDKGKVKGKELVSWAEETFGFTKTSLYNYIKISQIFSSGELSKEFEDLPVRTLVALTQNADLRDAAIKALEDGETVDSKWIAAYQKANKPEPEPKEDKKGKDINTDSETDSDIDDAYVVQLEKELEELRSSQQEAPDVPDMSEHFQGVADFMLKQTPHAVLFLDSGVTDKRKVNTAKRAMLKLYDDALVGEAGAPVREAIQAAADAIIGTEAPAKEEPAPEPKSEKKQKKTKKDKK